MPEPRRSDIVSNNASVWDAFVDLASTIGPVQEAKSRYADKPALVLHGREIAHTEAPGLIDLRITAAGWKAVCAVWAGDPGVEHEPGRRDWVLIHPSSVEDVTRLRPLISEAIHRNDS